MIRRECRLDDGSPGWILIAQAEHARIAADLATAWRLGDDRSGESSETETEFVPLEHRESFFAAVTHHDDGWIEWERAPDVVPDDGRPRSFTEMPLDETLDIWSRSIALAEALGPFAAWLVAGHFAMMLAGGSDRGDAPAAKWLNGVGLESARWFAAWRASEGSDVDVDAAEHALQRLRFFDALSLWLCCSAPARDEVDHDDCPAPPDSSDGEKTTSFTASRLNGDGGLLISPWPFRDAEVEMTADAFQLPRRRYENADDILAARTKTALSWRLTVSAPSA